MNSQTRKLWMEKIDNLCKQEDWKYAQFLCQEMLYEEPNFVAVRQILHGIRKYTVEPNRLQRFWLTVTRLIEVAYFVLRIKTKHRQLLETMDELLNINPNSPWLFRIFSEIMSGFGFFESAIFFIECIEVSERNEDDWLLLGEAYLGSEEFQLAVNIANKILAQSPDNIRARDLLWQSSVEQSMGTESSEK